MNTEVALVGPLRKRPDRLGESRMSESKEWTLPVPTAGKRYFGLGRSASYAAADRGEIPVVRIGRLLRVPVRAIEKMLDQVEPKSAA